MVLRLVLQIYVSPEKAFEVNGGSNPIPATRQQALENASFSRAFCCLNSSSKFRSWKRRGSDRRKVVAALKIQRDAHDLVAACPATPPRNLWSPRGFSAALIAVHSIAEFIAHDWRLRFRSLNHVHRDTIKPQ
jgi:hypothetical protein